MSGPAYVLACILLLAAMCPAAENDVIAKMDQQYNAARDTQDKATYEVALASITDQFSAMARDGKVTGPFLQNLSSQSRNAPTYFALLDALADKTAYTSALQSALLAAPGWEERDVFAFHLAAITTACANDNVFKLLRDKDDSIQAISIKLRIAHAFLTSKPKEVHAFALDLSKKLQDRFEKNPSVNAIEVGQKLNGILVGLGTKDAADALGDNLLGFGSATDWSAALDDVQHLADPRLYVSFLRKSLMLAEVDPAAKATIVEILFAHDADFPRTPKLTSILTQIASELEAAGQENDDFAAIKARFANQ